MASIKRISLARLKALFDDLDSNYDGLRERLDYIATRLLILLDPDIGGGGTALPPPENFIAVGGVLSATCSWDAVDSLDPVTYTVYADLDGTIETYDTQDTSILIGNLTAEAVYLMSVTATGAGRPESEPSDTVAVEILSGSSGTPTTPGGIAAVLNADNASADISWNDRDADTESVTLEYGRVGSGYENSFTGITATSFNFAPVFRGFDYKFRILGVSGSETGAYSSEVTVFIPSSDDVPPPTPTNLTGVAGPGLVTLSWLRGEPHPADFRNYIIEIGADAAFDTSIVRNAADGDIPNSAIELTPEVPFWFRVAAGDTADPQNVSGWSNEITVTPLAVDGDTTAPEPPTGLAFISSGFGSVDFSWTASTSSDVATYKIYGAYPPADSGGPYSAVGVVNSSVTSFTEDSLISAATHSWFVTAVDGAGNESRPSGFIATNPFSVLDGQVPGSGGIGPFTAEDGGNSSTAGITAQHYNGSTVHKYTANSIEQNAALFIPGMVASRAPRESALALTGGAAFQIQQGTPGYNTSVIPRVPNLHWSGTGTRENSVNIILRQVSELDDTPEWTTIVNKMINWGFEPGDSVNPYYMKTVAIRWNSRATIMVDCDTICRYVREPETITLGSGQVVNSESGEGNYTRSSASQHNLYELPSGSSLVQNTTCSNVGGHSFYFAHRPYAGGYGPPNLPFTRRPVSLLQNVHVANGDENNGFGSFSFQWYDYGSPSLPGVIIMRNCSYTSGWPFWKTNDYQIWDLNDPNVPSDAFRSKGGLAITNYAFCTNPQMPSPGYTGSNGNPNDWDPATMDYPVETVVIDNCLFHMHSPIKPMLFIDSAENVIIEDCTFIVEGGSSGFVFSADRYDIPNNVTRGTKGCGTITIRNCKFKGSIGIGVRQADGSYKDVPGISDGDGTKNLYKSVTFSGDTGDIISTVAYDPFTEGYDASTIINALDPFEQLEGSPTIDLQGYVIDWGIDGVTLSD